MKLRTRLSLTVAGIALLLVLPSAYGWTQLTELRDLARQQRLLHGAAYIALGSLQSSLAELKRTTTAYNVEPSPDQRLAMLGALAAARTDIADLERTGYQAPARAAADHVGRIGVATRRVELLMELGRFEESTTQLDTVKALIDASDSVIASIASEIDRRSENDLAVASRISNAAATTSLAALLFCLTLAVLLGAWTTRGLSLQITRLRNAMAVVADGDFTVPTDLAYTRGDEIGSVSRSFRAMTHRLSDLDRLKAEFLSFATHELRTPLNVVAGYAELLRDRVYGPLEPSQAEALEAIHEQTRVIARMVDQLLDLGRLEAGGMGLEIRDVPVADVLQRVERAFAALAQRKTVAFAVETDPSSPALAPLDADRLCDQVLGNLLTNAFKFTPEGGSVRVLARGDARRLTIEVSDTGPGIPASMLPRIFEKYYQVSDEARRQGAGLGLSIARDVVRAHGGTIEVESEPGRGTTFLVTIPLQAHPAEARAEEPALQRP